METDGDTVYRSGSALRDPRLLVRSVLDDAHASLGTGWRLFTRDLRSRYRRSVLGYAWILLPPVVTTLIWMFLSGAGVVDSAPTGISYGAYVLVGTTLWQAFVDALNAPLEKLNAAQGLLSAYRVPAEALLIVGVLDVSVNLVMRLILTVVVLMLTGVEPHLAAPLCLFGLSGLIALGTGLGGLIAPFGVLYGDVQRGVTIVISALFFLTPVAYAPDQLPYPVWINPIAALLLPTRELMVTGTTDYAQVFLAALIFALTLVPLGLTLSRVALPHLVDRSST